MAKPIDCATRHHFHWRHRSFLSAGVCCRLRRCGNGDCSDATGGARRQHRARCRRASLFHSRPLQAFKWPRAEAIRRSAGISIPAQGIAGCAALHLPPALCRHFHGCQLITPWPLTAAMDFSHRLPSSIAFPSSSGSRFKTLGCQFVQLQSNSSAGRSRTFYAASRPRASGNFAGGFPVPIQTSLQPHCSLRELQARYCSQCLTACAIASAPWPCALPRIWFYFRLLHC